MRVCNEGAAPSPAVANGAKPDEPLADPDGQLEMLRERFGHVQDSLKRGAARRAARIERAGPGVRALQILYNENMVKLVGGSKEGAGVRALQILYNENM
jgi:hypothetical protein